VSKILLAWSSGKDSAWSLHVLRSQGAEIGALLTTLNEAADGVAMHGVRRTVLEAQAEAAGVPLWQVPLPWPCTNDDYQTRMAAACVRAVAEGFETIAFGDLFLRDIRDYRERQLAGTGIKPLFPLWEIPTGNLAEQMIDAGLKAKITCIDPSRLDRSYAGRDFGPGFLANLPAGVDPCGENGEFHTFVYACPDFAQPMDVSTGEIVERDGFVFADVVPASLL
jgi:uncharacterized protein (TIGR00290 family)